MAWGSKMTPLMSIVGSSNETSPGADGWAPELPEPDPPPAGVVGVSWPDIGPHAIAPQSNRASELRMREVYTGVMVARK